MSTIYKFQAEKFAITDENLHLLRNNFNYENIPISAVTSIEIVDGKDLKNWWWVAFLGAAFCAYAFYDIVQIILLFQNPTVYHVAVERLVIPVIPLLLGIYSLRIAFRNTRVMIVRAGSKKFYFSLRDIIRENQFLQFIDYLKSVYPSFQNRSK